MMNTLRIIAGRFCLLVLVIVLVGCAYNPTTGKTDIGGIYSVTVEKNPVREHVYYFRMKMGGVALHNEKMIRDRLIYEADRLAREKGYVGWTVIGSEVYQMKLPPVAEYELEFSRNMSDFVSPCDDPILDKHTSENINEMSDREFEYYRIKMRECEEYRRNAELGRQSAQLVKEKKRTNELLYLILLAIWIPFYLSTW